MQNFEQRVNKLRQTNLDADPQVSFLFLGIYSKLDNLLKCSGQGLILTSRIALKVLNTAMKLSEVIGYTLAISVATVRNRESDINSAQSDQRSRSKSSKLVKQQKSKVIKIINQF